MYQSFVDQKAYTQLVLLEGRYSGRTLSPLLPWPAVTGARLTKKLASLLPQMVPVTWWMPAGAWTQTAGFLGMHGLNTSPKEEVWTDISLARVQTVPG